MNKNWVYAAGIRAIKTVAQTAIAMIGTNVLITDVNWQAVLSASMLAGVLSILMSTAGLPELEYELPQSQQKRGAGRRSLLD